MLHQWRIKRKYFELLRSGEKQLEVRVGYGFVRKVREGDKIVFADYSPTQFLVRRITTYHSFQQMLLHEEASKIIPRQTTMEVLHALQGIYPPQKEKLGVYVLELVPPPTIIHLSKTNPKVRSAYADELYQLTDWICHDYPDHRSHYYQKYLPGLADGTREITGCYIGQIPAGVIILKNTPEEKKISTLYIADDYRGLGLASKLVQASESFLGTLKPTITVADYKVPQFEGLIKRFGWEHTSTLPQGYYNDHSSEWVFN